MIRKNKLLALAATAAVILPVTVASATTTNIDAVASFLNAITLGGEVDMDFGNVEFAAAPGVGDLATLGTNGSITYAANFSGAGTGTPGEVSVTAGTNGETVDVFCDATATMAEAGGGTIDVVSIQAVAEGSEAGPGLGNACAGVAGAAATSLVLNVGTLDTFKFGGQIDGSTAVGFVAGDYSTGTAGGNDIQVDIFYN